MYLVNDIVTRLIFQINLDSLLFVKMSYLSLTIAFIGMYVASECMYHAGVSSISVCKSLAVWSL